MVMLLSSSSLYVGAYFIWRGYKWLHTKRRHQHTRGIVPTVQLVEASCCSPECRHSPSFGHDHIKDPELPPLQEDEFDDKYVTVSKLGRGGFGVVYKGVDLSSRELVAVKIEVGQYGQQEMDILKSVQDCPNVIRLLDGFLLPSETIIVMELAWGSLEDLDIRDKEDDLKMAIFSDIVAGVGSIHYKMIAHRDLKPANILIKGGKALIADFGIAQCVGTPGYERYVSSRSGTNAYMAPEVVRGGSYSALRADVWSVGCIIYFLLTGTHLHGDVSMANLVILHACAYVEVPEIVPVNPITSSLVESMYSALEYDPDQRPHVYML